MAENEAIFLYGAERTANYSGYDVSFKYVSEFNDRRPKDEKGPLANYIVAIDALEC